MRHRLRLILLSQFDPPRFPPSAPRLPLSLAAPLRENILTRYALLLSNVCHDFYSIKTFAKDKKKEKKEKEEKK